MGAINIYGRLHAATVEGVVVEANEIKDDSLNKSQAELNQEITNSYHKPSTGIPASDLAEGVIPDVSQFITKTVNDLTNYYLKDDTYTKAEVAALIGAIQQFHYEVYPTTGDVSEPQNNVLYLIGPIGSGSDKYEEYVYPNSTTGWVKIGDTSIDLSGYVTTSALNTALATKLDSSIMVMNGGTAYSTSVEAENAASTSIWAGNPKKTIFMYWYNGSQRGVGTGLIKQLITLTNDNIYECYQTLYLGINIFKRIISLGTYSSETGLFNVTLVGAWANKGKLGSYNDLIDKPDIPVEKGTGTNSVQQKGAGAIASGYSAYAEGTRTTAIGLSSHAEGGGTFARGNYSHAEGTTTNANGNYSHTEGYFIVANNISEHAEGSYNKSNKASDTYGDAGNTQHSVGIGTFDNNKKNAHEIMQNGDHYIYGIGGYDGTNPSSAKTLQQVIGELGTMTEITYSALKTLRDNSQLVPGMQYRITDYVTKINNLLTVDLYNSAEHQFDIIVVADDVNKLNENARACLHEGDTYFANAKLEAWQLKYTLDSNPLIYSWAPQAGFSKGFIYWMKDEFDNECPYDFKNIRYKIYKITACDDRPNRVGAYVFGNMIYNFSKEYFGYAYTFSTIDNNNTIVDSTVYDKYCRNNKILLCNNHYDAIIGSYVLNRITIFGKNSSNNTFSLNCEIMVVSGSCNTFGHSCNNIVFTGCSGNTIGYSCNEIFFEQNCNGNVIGNNCRLNFGTECSNNSCGSYNQLELMDYCMSNIFENSVYAKLEKNYTQCITIESRNYGITITSQNETSSSNRLINITVAKGVRTYQGNIYKTIRHNTFNDAFRTVYKSTGSIEVEV